MIIIENENKQMCVLPPLLFDVYITIHSFSCEINIGGGAYDRNSNVSGN